jgi:ankyrin repeat protein
MKMGRKKGNKLSAIDRVLLEYMEDEYPYVDQVENLLTEGANVHVKDQSHYTPLHFACKYGHIDVAELLIAHGANIDRTGKEEWPPIFMSIGGGHFDITRMLMSNKANLSAMSNNGHSVLSFLLKVRNAPRDLIIELAKKSISHLSKVSSDKIPLHMAIDRGDLELFDLLLSAGADINAAAIDGSTPLHLAAHCNFPDIAGRLLEAGAMLEAKNDADQTPLHIAASRGSTQVLDFFLKRGALVDAQDVYGGTPLHHAAYHGEVVDSLDLLITHRADVRAVTKTGKTAEDIARLHAREQAIGFFTALKSKEIIAGLLRDN